MFVRGRLRGRNRFAQNETTGRRKIYLLHRYRCRERDLCWPLERGGKDQDVEDWNEEFAGIKKMLLENYPVSGKYGRSLSIFPPAYLMATMTSLRLINGGVQGGL